MFDLGWVLYLFVGLIVLTVLSSAIKIVQEYERAGIFRLGRFVGLRGPGLVLIIPFIERARKVDLRVVTMDVPQQECITLDNVTVTVDAVVYFRVVAPDDAILKVLDYAKATSLLAQTTLRNVVGQSELDELLAHRDRLNEKIQTVVDEGTNPWGVKVSLVEVKDVQLPESMQRSMAAQAEAERDRRAKVVHAEGEAQAAEKLAQAAKIIGTQPAAIQLRYLQAMTAIATEKTNTILFPLPMDLLRAFVEQRQEDKKEDKKK
ncbi:MAG: slipin family protein [Dehalococcoidia bacterium]|jgi:regulator of protease activity HflC (stomatin/prohibitin superfamily)|nr:slipin family protein [Dehalococcoidia bacterium]